MRVINLECDRGDTERLRLSLQDPNGDPITFHSGMKLWFTVKAGPGAIDDAALIQKTYLAGITQDETPGDYLIEISPGDTAGFPSVEVKHYYDVQVKVDDAITTVVKGRITFLPDVTRAIT